MRKVQLILILCLLVAVGSAYRQLKQIETKNLEVARNIANERATAGLPPTKSELLDSVKKSEEFVKMVQKEAESISQLNNHPEEVQKRLKELADKMQEADVELLQKSALNTNLKGDERFLSVYILGESNLPKAQESLEAIAITPIPTLKEARLTNQEEILRAQAVESLRQEERIKRVISKTDNTFITDRAQRNLLFREGKVSSTVEQQDEAALNQLLQKSHQ